MVDYRRKIALLIGISEYQYRGHFTPLRAPTKDMEKMDQVLSDQDIGNFDEIKTLPNPDSKEMRKAINELFAKTRAKKDLLLLFFSGHGVKNDEGKLYFATSDTQKDPQEDLMKGTAVPAYEVHNLMEDCPSKYQVVILDCCFSGAWGLLAKKGEKGGEGNESVDIGKQLGGEGRAVLTSSTFTQYSYESKESEISIYTSCLIKGIETGEADRDKDGMVSVDELHQYAKEKVQEAVRDMMKPQDMMKPEIYPVKEGYNILLTKVPSPKYRYRKYVESLVSDGEISPTGRATLNERRKELGLRSEEADDIEKKVLQDYHEFQQKLYRYERAFIDAVEQEEYPLPDSTCNELEQLQRTLGLSNIDVEKIEEDWRSALLSRKESINRTVFLKKIENNWVDLLYKYLNGEANEKAPIVLDLEERPDAVMTAATKYVPDQSPKPLPPGTKVIDKFDQYGDEQNRGSTLLILGNPGSGKTIALLELTHILLDRYNHAPKRSMPLVLNLSSWRGREQTITDWLVQQLKLQYQVPERVAYHWVKKEKLLLLLDGLDEVRNEFRDACVQALNQFHQLRGITGIVVCCRISEYYALKDRLNFQCAIALKPLKSEQIQQYLASTGAELAAVNTALQEDTQLAELAKSPLMLNIITKAYKGDDKELPVDNLPRMGLEERRKHLFNKYIERMFRLPRRTQVQYREEDVRRWINWLAKRMLEESQTDFFIERIQPSWLRSKIKRRIYGLIDGSIGGLISGLMYGLSGWFLVGNRGLIGGLVLGFVIYFFPGLVGGLESSEISPFFEDITKIKTEIQMADRLKPSLKMPKDKLINELQRGLILTFIGILFGAILGLLLGLITIDISSLIFLILIGLIGGLGYGLIRSIMGPETEITKKVSPNQGIKDSLRNVGYSSILISPVSLLISALLEYSLTRYVSFNILIIALLLAVAYGMTSSGMPAIQHFSLRLVLWLNGYIPWNYARFLDYATELIFMQKVGCGYQFFHNWLRDHFAKMDRGSVAG